MKFSLNPNGQSVDSQVGVWLLGLALWAFSSVVLSQSRVTFLQVRGMSITTVGRGDRDPEVSTCGWQINARSFACNAPKRRVVLEVMGQRR